MKKYLLSIVFIFTLITPACAEGGKLVLLVEECPYGSEKYFAMGDATSMFDMVRAMWDEGKRIISVKETPMGWFGVAATKTGYEQQSHSCRTRKKIIKLIEEESKKGKYVTSIAPFFGFATYWLTFFSSKEGVTDQIHGYMKRKKIAAWAEKQRKKGYQITCLGGASTSYKWMVVMCKGTNIAQQDVRTYEGRAEMLADVQNQWKNGWNVQIVDCSQTGKYVAVYCKYADGHRPKQHLAVCQTKEEADEFIKENTGHGSYITYAGGSYCATLLCNEETTGGKMNKIFGIANGLTTSINTLVSGNGGISSDDANASGNTQGGTGSSGASNKGKVKTRHSDDCTHCYGRGVCQYCNGDGYNYVAGTPVRCKGCPDQIGKCKWCKGTGKK